MTKSITLTISDDDQRCLSRQPLRVNGGATVFVLREAQPDMETQPGEHVVTLSQGTFPSPPTILTLTILTDRVEPAFQGAFYTRASMMRTVNTWLKIKARDLTEEFTLITPAADFARRRWGYELVCNELPIEPAYLPEAHPYQPTLQQWANTARSLRDCLDDCITHLVEAGFDAESEGMDSCRVAIVAHDVLAGVLTPAVEKGTK